MTTAQKIRGSVTNPQQQEVAQWTKIFPPKIKSQQQSVLFVKKLLTVSLSNIAWLRSMFPEDVYADKSLGGLKIKTLKEKTNNEEAQTLTKWLIGAFDAIEKSYLREMVFFIYLDEQKPEDVYEKYWSKGIRPVKLPAKIVLTEKPLHDGQGSFKKKAHICVRGNFEEGRGGSFTYL